MIYAHCGFKEFVLALGYRGEIIKEYFYNYEIYNEDFSVYLGGGSKRIELPQPNRTPDCRVAGRHRGTGAQERSHQANRTLDRRR
jgi:glucose-1-phosphate cytidylyltransferase